MVLNAWPFNHNHVITIRLDNKKSGSTQCQLSSWLAGVLKVAQVT